MSKSKYATKVAQRGKNPTPSLPTPPQPAAPAPAPVTVKLVATKPIQTQTPEINSSKHFSAGVICFRVEEVWCVAGITDRRFPADLRIPGGTNKNAPWETPLQTLCRELGEELNIEADPATCCGRVHTVSKGSHTQYFFLVRNWSGTLREGEFSDSDGETLTARWVPLREFWRRCFRNHREGFKKAIEVVVKAHPDPTLREQAEEAEIIFHI